MECPKGHEIDHHNSDNFRAEYCPSNEDYPIRILLHCDECCCDYDTYIELYDLTEV